MQHSSLLLSLFLVLYISTSPTATASDRLWGVKLGGYQPIKDLNDTHVIEIALFAVTEHNKEAHSSLKFVKVVRGEEQLVAGTNYKLIIEATDDGVSSQYLAVVYERPWEKSFSLTNFVNVGN